jgi:predicted RND superfamily exporter protein
MLTASKLQAFGNDLRIALDYEVDGEEIINANEGEAKDNAQIYAGKHTFFGSGGTHKKCHVFSGTDCAFQTVLNVFGFGMDNGVVGSLTDSMILPALKTWDAAPKYSFIPSLNVSKTFELTDVLGGITRDAAGDVVSATILRSSFFLTEVGETVASHEKDQVSAMTDPVADEWEVNLICELGLTDKHPYIKDHPCSAANGLTHTGLLSRSLGDEFGNSIRNDIAKIAMSYFLIVIYLIVCLGKRDHVHSMVAQSFFAILVIGFSFVLANGLGGYFQVKTSPLNNNIMFLLLGLGVDDAFVICSEFVRHTTAHPELSIEDRIQMTTRSGGISVLVTSLTDALTFLIGATTALPALSSFCIYAGIGVWGCFVFMMTLFLPLLALNARRAEANRFDVFCCFKAKVEHKIEEPLGCCVCDRGCATTQHLQKASQRFGVAVTKTMPGKSATLVIFAGVFFAGLSGVVQLQKEFKLEWFFPEGSYVKDFVDLNDAHFGQGQKFTVYGHDFDLYAKRDKLTDVADYLNAQDFIVGGSVNTWWNIFETSAGSHADAAAFYNDLSQWLSGAGSAYISKVKWVDDNDPTKGVADISLLEAALKSFEGEGSGAERYETYYTMRQDMKDLVGVSETSIFPYHMDFLYWEENGVIDSELLRNLVVAFGVMCTIVAILIPKPKIALVVTLNIVMAIVEVIGFAHFWGVTMNGVSTIYFLMCAGFSVDYSAHIAHAFNTSEGSSADRAVEALTRLGPCVWNAIVSTFLAVIVIGFAKSFVFQVFFKILCLVCIIAGMHGIWLLPTVLSIVGGDAERKDATKDKVGEDAKAASGPVTGG